MSNYSTVIKNFYKNLQFIKNLLFACVYYKMKEFFVEVCGKSNIVYKIKIKIVISKKLIFLKNFFIIYIESKGDNYENNTGNRIKN